MSFTKRALADIQSYLEMKNKQPASSQKRRESELAQYRKEIIALREGYLTPYRWTWAKIHELLRYKKGLSCGERAVSQYYKRHQPSSEECEAIKNEIDRSGTKLKDIVLPGVMQ